MVNVTTQTQGNNSTLAASTAYVDAAVAGANERVKEKFTLTATDITNKYVTLGNTPSSPSSVSLDVIGGPPQEYGVDFVMDGTNPDRLSWDGYALDGVLEAGDKIRVTYNV